MANSHVCLYSKNGGAFTGFASGGTVAFTNGDTLAFKIKDIFAGDEDTITVTDHANGAQVGTFSAANSHS